MCVEVDQKKKGMSGRRCTACHEAGHNRASCLVLSAGLAATGKTRVGKAEIEAAVTATRRCSGCRHTGHTYPTCPIIKAGQEALRVEAEEAAMLAASLAIHKDDGDGDDKCVSPPPPAAAAAEEERTDDSGDDEDDRDEASVAKMLKGLSLGGGSDDDTQTCGFCHVSGHTQDTCKTLARFVDAEDEADGRGRRRPFGRGGGVRQGMAPGIRRFVAPGVGEDPVAMSTAAAAQWAIKKTGLGARRDAPGWCYTLFVQGSLETKIGKTKNIARRTRQHHTTSASAVIGSIKCLDFHTTETVVKHMLNRVADKVEGTSSTETWYVDNHRATTIIRAAAKAVDALPVNEGK